MLKMTGREDKIPVVFIICGVFAISGAVLAALFDNAYMIPPLAIGMMFIPVWYIRLTASHYKKDVSEELETALSIITTAYIRNEDIVTAVEENIDNDVFHEWCDALLLCQQDRGLKTTLSPIVAKLSDIRVVNSELELLLAEPRKEFIIMAILVAANIPIMYFLNKDWYNVLMHTAVGKMVLALDISAIFISSAFVVKLTRPIEFRR